MKTFSLAPSYMYTLLFCMKSGKNKLAMWISTMVPPPKKKKTKKKRKKEKKKKKKR